MPLRLSYPMGNFQKLLVWQKAKDLAVNLYKITNQGKLANDYSLKDQIRRAAISIPSNIAEGDELDTDKQSIRHFHYAKGSTAELLTQSLIKTISAMLMRLIQARTKP